MNYIQLFYENGDVKAEGWMEEDQKENYWYYYNSNGSIKAKGNYKYNKKQGYWFFYDKNGHLKKEGHYRKGKPVSWWRYYIVDSVMSVKLFDGKKDGLALYKVNGKLVKGEYYKNDIKTHEWSTLQEFRKDRHRLNLSIND